MQYLYQEVCVARPRDKQLTIKEAKLVDAYMDTGNATEAAMQAYNCNSRQSANAVASEVLARPIVQAAISDKRVQLLDSIADKLKETDLLGKAIARAEQLIASTDDAIALTGIKAAADIAKLVQAPSNKPASETLHQHVHLPKR